jgi:hypothetical protein
LKGVILEHDGMHCGHGKMKMGILITAFGLIFLFGNLDLITTETVNILWPLLIVLIGLGKILKSVTCTDGCCDMKKKKK